MNRLRLLMLLAAALCLGLGLFLPIVRFESFYVFSRAPSIVEFVQALWLEGDVALAVLVGLFSIVFPVLKLAVLAVQMHRGEKGGLVHRVMPHVSRWSMMDVMLAAIVIFAAKSSGLASAAAQPGLWFYAASALIAGFIPLVGRHAAR